MAEGLSDTIRQNAAQPASAQAGGVSAAQHNLRDQIAADKYLASKAAATSRTPGRALRLTKLVHRGTV